MFKDQGSKLIVPGHIYEIQELIGVPTVVNLGPAALGDRPSTSLLAGASWMNSIDHILEVAGSRIILTQKEVHKYLTPD